MRNTNDKIDIPESEIHEELGRVLNSPIFLASERLGSFLRFTVESTLQNQSEVLKEYVIGTEVYNRRPPYDPRQDSIVRSEARRLRSKLKQYYESEGRSDPVLIYFRPGSYVPVFRKQISLSRAADVETALNGEVLIDRRGEALAVFPFLDLSNTPVTTAFAAAITDELIHNMTRAEGVRVILVSSVQVSDYYESDLSLLAQKLGVRWFLKGSVRQVALGFRVTVQSLTCDGFQLWSQQFETQPELDEISLVAENIARSLNDRFRPKSSCIRRMQASVGSGIANNLSSLYRSEALLDEGIVSDVEMQISKFEQIARDVPGYPDPLCDVAECWYELALRGAVVSANAISEARSKALEAAKLDPEMVHSVGCEAALLGLEWNWEAAEEMFEKSLKLNPHATTLRQYAMNLAAQGHFEKSRYYLEKSGDWNPFSYRQRTAWTRFLNLSRNYTELDQHISMCALYGPLPLETQLYLAVGYCALGRRLDAMKIVENSRKYAGSHPTIAALLAEILGLCGAVPLAHELTQRFKLLSPTAGISRFRQCLLATALNDTAAAFSFLTSAADERDPELIWLSVEPRLDSLHGDRRFGELAGRVMNGSVLS